MIHKMFYECTLNMRVMAHTGTANDARAIPWQKPSGLPHLPVLSLFSELLIPVPALHVMSGYGTGMSVD